MDVVLYIGKDQPRIEQYSLDELTLGNSGFPGCLIRIGSFGLCPNYDLNTISIALIPLALLQDFRTFSVVGLNWATECVWLLMHGI